MCLMNSLSRADASTSPFRTMQFLKVESKVKSIIKPAGPKSVEVAGEVEAVAGAEDAQ